MDDREKFNETTLPEKEKNYSSLNMDYITDAYYMQGKRVCKSCERKKFHDLNIMICISRVILIFGRCF